MLSHLALHSREGLGIKSLEKLFHSAMRAKNTGVSPKYKMLNVEIHAF